MITAGNVVTHSCVCMFSLRQFGLWDGGLMCQWWWSINAEGCHLAKWKLFCACNRLLVNLFGVMSKQEKIRDKLNVVTWILINKIFYLPWEQCLSIISVVHYYPIPSTPLPPCHCPYIWWRQVLPSFSNTCCLRCKWEWILIWCSVNWESLGIPQTYIKNELA